MSSSQVLNTVPVFDGSNYRKWADRMKAYLQMFNLWGIVNGDEKEPEEPLPTTVGSGDSAREVPPTAELLEKFLLLRNRRRRTQRRRRIGTGTMKLP